MGPLPVLGAQFRALAVRPYNGLPIFEHEGDVVKNSQT